MVSDHDHLSADRRLGLVLALNVLIVVAQVVAGLVAGSLGLLADAAHNLADVAAIAVALYALRLTRRPATASRSFGFHRSSVLAAQANAAGLLVVTTAVAVEAIRRLAHPTGVEGGWVVAVALVALVVNGGGARLLRDAGDDLNRRAVMLHLLADAGTSAVVAGAGMVIAITGRFDRLDPIASLVVALVISAQAVRLVSEASDVLLESTPKGLDVDSLTSAIARVPGVDGVHDVHAWSLSSDVRALSAHLVMSGHPTLEEAQSVAGAVKQAIAEPFAIAHATFELECESCVDPDVDPCAIDGLREVTG